jgi:hypothetical protein
MALSLTVSNTDVIGLEEYIDHVKTNVDLLDIDSIVASAPKFKGLMNNKRLLTDVLNRQLQDWGTFQEGNSYTAQTFMLGGGPGFFVRVNIWSPPSEIPEVRLSEAQNFYYLVPHDHNFSFMTGGYFGAGYRTSIWEYDHQKLAGLRGEHVELRFLEDTSLPEGKIMLYRKSTDVHSQEHADEFSISINLMVIPEETVMNRANQFIFDVEASTLRSTLSSTAGRVMVCDLARHVGDARSVDLLDSLSTKHPDSRVRGASIRSLVGLVPGDTEAIYRRATRDSHLYVRRLGESGLETGGFAEAVYAENRVDPHAGLDSGPGAESYPGISGQVVLD